MVRMSTRRKARQERKRRARQLRTNREALQWVGFDSVLEGGQVYLGGGDWAVTMRLHDVNYQQADEQSRKAVLESWATLLNGFTGDQSMQVTVRTRRTDPQAVGEKVRMGRRGDGLDGWREEFDRLLVRKIRSATNGATSDKYLTVRVHGDANDPSRGLVAVNKLAISAQAQLSSMGCHTVRLDRAGVLRLMHSILAPDDRFSFSEEGFASQPRRSARDYVTPYAFDLRNPAYIRVLENEKDYCHTVVWLRDFPPRLSDSLVSQITDLRADTTISLHFDPMNRSDGLKAVKNQKTGIDMQVDSVRQRNIRNNEPEDVLPPNLREQSEQVDDLLDDLNSSNSKLIRTLAEIGVSAPDRKTLDRRVDQVRQVLNGLSITGASMRHMVLPALQSELPLGLRSVPMSRTLTTPAAAIMIPFTSQEHFDPTGEFYGTNTLTGNLVAVDRTRLMNQNGFVLGASGSGKSAATKWEIEHILLDRPQDRVIIIDPENEYGRIRRAFGGALVKVSAGTDQRINPLDISLDAAPGEDPVRDKTSQVMAMMDSLIGGTKGLDPVKTGILDMTVTRMYQDMRPGDPQPTLGTLRDRLGEKQETAYQELSAALQPFVVGSKAGFNGQTNVSTDGRLVVYDTLDLDAGMKTFGMMVVLDHIWNEIKENRGGEGRVWVYCDEFHTFFSNKYSADFFLSIYKRARKYGAGITGITQNVDELLESDQARLMFANSAFMMLLRMNATDAETIQGLLHFSQAQRQAFSTADPGCGLIVAGNDYVPFDGRIPSDSRIFDLNQTNAATMQR